MGYESSVQLRAPFKELSVANTAALARYLGHVDARSRLSLDLATVESCDAVGVATVGAAYRRHKANGSVLRVVNALPEVRQAFENVGLVALFE